MKKIIEKYITNMPSLPTTVTKVMEICEDRTSAPADLNRIISMDPVLMGRVMQLINSAFYGRPNKITSLVRAIILLGLNTVKNLALSTAVLGSLPENRADGALNMEGFWEHSLCTAVIAKKIASATDVDPKLQDEYFIAGLLHDIGKIPLSEALAPEYLAVISKADIEHSNLVEAEDRLLGFEHQQIGALIADHWKIEGAIRDSILHHHDSGDYDGEFKKLVYTIAVSDYASLYLERGFAGNRYPKEPPQRIYEELGIGFSDIEAFSSDIRTEIDKARVFLSLS